MTFDNKGIFTTNIGAVISLICGSVMMIVYVVKTMKLLGSNSAAVSMIPMPLEIDQEIDLWNLNYMFAIQNVEPRVGRLSV